MRPVRFLGDSLKCLRDFPEDARHDSGYQLDKVQRGEQPDNFKPLVAVGKGVEEIRITEDSGAYRVIYVARRAAPRLWTYCTLSRRSRRRRRRRIFTSLRGVLRNFREVLNEET